jgi:AcrR family transcriptional regulator
MSTKKETAKRKLLEAAASLLEATENPDDVTVRKIAEMAGVGVGLINYYFESRDQLIHEAIAMKMVSLASFIENHDEYRNNPVQYLKNLLISMSDIGMKDRKLNKVSAEYELLNGDFSVCLYLLPALREIYNGKKSETELRLLAYQIIIPFQSIYIRQQAFHMYSGINIENKNERDYLIGSIVDNLIK